MLITVDTSVVLSVLLNEPTKPLVVQATLGAELISPASLDWEIANALSGMFKRRTLLPEQAEKALHDFEFVKIERKPVSLQQAVRIAANLKIYAYDAFMIAVAEQYDCKLLTLDGGLSSAARRAGIQLLEVTS